MIQHADDGLVGRYEKLRRRLEELDQAGLPFGAEAEAIDQELVQIESQLPDWYAYPGDET